MNQVETSIQNGQVLNVFTRQFEPTTLWINRGQIVAVGNQSGYTANTIIDATDKYIVPGFIDAHMHIESSMVSPSELGKVLLQHGVTGIVADPHELANIEGMQGIEYMINDARQTPLDVYYMLPSSVPCTPFDHSGAVLTAKDLKPLYQYPEVHGLAEVMDYPAVAAADPDTIAKINDSITVGFHADGHGAGLNVEQLDVFRRAHIHTDHEATSVTEVNERLATGFSVFLREGTVERDLANTINAVTPENAHNFSFCTDDKIVDDLLDEGSIDYSIKLAISLGLPPELAYTMASYNAAIAHDLSNVGALTAGYQADLVILNGLNTVNIDAVFKNGMLITESDTTPLSPGASTVHHHLSVGDLQLLMTSDHAHVIGIQPNHIVTDHLKLEVPVHNGMFQPDLDRDLIKIAVIERHHDLGTVGVGIVKGFELHEGAIATTVAHDSHNLVVAGTNDQAIIQAVQEVTRVGGGIAVADDHNILATMPLSIGGVMSAKTYQDALVDLKSITDAYYKISSNRDFNPFLTLSFLTLPVIPSIKITDQGLYDFDQQKFINVSL